MSTRTDELSISISQSTAVVRLSRPAKRNSLSTPILEQLTTAIGELASRTDLNSIVLTGTGNVFTAGADIHELVELTPGMAVAFAERGRELCETIAGARQFTVAAINGHCMGGGLDLALACDVRVASPNALFAHPGVRIGIVTGWGGTQRLPRLIGRTRALEMFLTARLIGADEAYRSGLVDYVVDSPVEFAQQLAEKAHKAHPRSGFL